MIQFENGYCGKIATLIAFKHKGRHVIVILQNEEDNMETFSRGLPMKRVQRFKSDVSTRNACETDLVAACISFCSFEEPIFVAVRTNRHLKMGNADQLRFLVAIDVRVFNLFKIKLYAQ